MNTYVARVSLSTELKGVGKLAVSQGLHSGSFTLSDD